MICMNLSGFPYLNEARIDQMFCDVVIRIEDRTFPCHRIILFATMEYFRSMFSGAYVEADNKEIRLNNVNADDFEQLLTFIYGSPVPVSESDILRLLILANYLGLKSMEDACVKNIVKNNALYASDSVVNIFRFARATRNTTLVDVLIKAVAKNFAQATKTGKLYLVSSGELLKILNHPNLTCDIDAILDFLREWTKFQSDEEKKMIPEILNAVSVKVGGHLADWISKTLMDTTPRELDSTHHNVPDNDLLGLLSDLEKDSSSNATVKPPFLLLTADDVRDNDRLQQISLYRLQSANNEIKHHDTNYLLSPNPAYCGKLFFVGDTSRLTMLSCEESSSSKDGMRYSINIFSLYYAKNHNLRYAPSMINACRGVEFESSEVTATRSDKMNIFTAAMNGSRIYLYDNIEFLMYALDQNVWCPVDGYKNIFAPTMSSFGSCLYMAGGLDFDCENPMRSRSCSSVRQSAALSETNGKLFKQYDLRDGKWLQLPNMKNVHCRAASCVYNDTIYVSGGEYLTYYENSNVEYYDLRAGKWSEITTPMPKAKMGHCCMAYDDHLWFFGGQELQPDAFDPTWFSYSLKENVWSKIFTIRTKNGKNVIKRILDVHPGVNI